MRYIYEFVFRLCKLMKVYKFMGVNGEVFFGINLLEFYLFFIYIFSVYLKV